MFNQQGDLTSKAVIRDAALRLFAEHGPDAVTVRRIASAAGVSPALVVHHYGSKQGLRDAVDEHVAGIFDALFAQFTGEQGAALGELVARGSGASVAELLLRGLPPDSPVPAYLRRLLLAGDPVGTATFQRWYQAGQSMVRTLVEQGLVLPGGDPEMRVAILMINDLAVLLLREQLTAVVGVDPLGVEGAARWAEELLAIYRHGLFVSGDAGEEPP